MSPIGRLWSAANSARWGKARGVKLGGPKLAQARKQAVKAIEANADRHAANVLPIIREVQRAGAKSLRYRECAKCSRHPYRAWRALGSDDGEQRAGTGVGRGSPNRVKRLNGQK
jgi:hypothetical protein